MSAASRPRSRSGSSKSKRKEEGTSVATRILQVALKEDCDIDALSDLASGYPMFAGRVLAWVNSPAFRRARTVVDVRQAARLLGRRGLRNLALGMVVSGMAPPGPKAHALIANGLRRALGAHAIAEHIAREHADAAFTTGLFLDAGLVSLAAEALDEADQLARFPAADRPLQERALGRRPHPAVSAALAESYGLPDDILHAILHHHDAEAPEPLLSRVAWLAERLSAVFEGGPLAEAQTRAREAAQTVGLPPDVLETLIELMPTMVMDGAKIFERDVGIQRSVEDLLYDANTQLLEMNQQYEQMLRALEMVVAEKEALAIELQDLNTRLHKLASHDPLTGLANRRMMNEQLKQLLAQADRQGTSLTVSMVDLDHFKQVNDSYGHDAGDAVLKVLAETLKGALRDCDVVARYGGEEFILLLPNTTSDEAYSVLNRVRERIKSTPVLTSRGAIQVTASLGASTTSGPDCSTSDLLISCADEALYAAKAAGRDRVVTK